MSAQNSEGKVFEDYDQALDYLYDLQFFGVKFGLENTGELLRRLGDPHLKYRTLHVTGTNGKGSVCAFLESALRCAGRRTGLYTSPHLVDFTERVQVDGKEASRADITRLAGLVRAHVAEMAQGPENRQCTFFEATTALAFKHFAEAGIDIGVIEVGMGGRLDSTNHVRPEACVITSVGLEHTQYLGDTLVKVAYEKAGIIKAGVPVVVGDVGPDALPVIEGVAKERGARMHLLGRDFTAASVKRKGIALLRYRGLGGLSGDYALGLLGDFQLTNAALALACLEAANLGINREQAKEALRMTRWPGRLQVVHRNPTVVLDGAHNPHGARGLAGTMPRAFGKRNIVLVVGMMQDKDHRAFLDALAPIVRTTVVTRARFGRSLPAEKLAEMLEAADVAVAANVCDALAEASKRAGRRDVVLVTGSLYVVGEALAILEMRGPEASEVVRRLRALYGAGAFPGRDVGGNERVEPGERDPFQVLISTILSQRTRDVNTHRASVALFAKYDTPKKLAAAPPTEVERLVRPSGFYRQKARFVKAAASMLVEEFHGEVPRDMESLLKLPAVGRKTANCVLVYGFGVPAIPVDVHVHRISNRLGLAATRTPEETEGALESAVPRRLWIEINRLMVRHGQEVCLPRNPRCAACDLRDICHHNIRRAVESWLRKR